MNNCSFHNNRQGVNTCNKCGEWLCEDCSVEVEGVIVCKKCIANSMNNRGHKPSREYEARRSYSYSDRHINGLLTLMFSALPGANFMYMGLMKRGIFFLTTFMASIVLTAISASALTPLFACSIAVIWITSFFDGLEKRRRLNAGMDCPDSVEDILSWIRKYKLPLAAIVFVSVLLSAIEEILFFLASYTGAVYTHNGYFFGMHTSMIGSLVVIIVGLFFLVRAFSSRSRRKERHEEYDESYDRYNNK